MNLDAIPLRAQGHHVEMLGNEQVLFGEARAAAYFLNETASLIFSLCDGQRSVGEIVELLTDAYPDEAGQVATDVIAIIDNLQTQGVLVLGA